MTRLLSRSDIVVANGFAMTSIRLRCTGASSASAVPARSADSSGGILRFLHQRARLTAAGDAAFVWSLAMGDVDLVHNPLNGVTGGVWRARRPRRRAHPRVPRWPTRGGLPGRPARG